MPAALVRYRTRICVLLGVLLVTCGVLFLWGYGTCAFAKNTDESLRTCYAVRLYTLIDTRGAATGLAYTRYVIYPANLPGVAHTYLHMVGAAAYHEDPDLHAIATYMAPYADMLTQPTFTNSFDGFIHGYVSEYLFFSSTSLSETMTAICNGGDLVPGFPGMDSNCYHAVGHGAMYAVGNELDEALDLCDSLPTREATQHCYGGVFMENEFLLNPTYHPQIPRPASYEYSSPAMCARFAHDRLDACSKYVGVTFLLLHPDDVAGAFAECHLLPHTEAICVQHLGAIEIGNRAIDLDTAKEMCSAHVAPPLDRVCLEGAQARFPFDSISAQPHTMRSDILDFFRSVYFGALTLMPTRAHEMHHHR